MRRQIGQRSFIHPAARILIENENGDFLFVKKKENNAWGLPAGALEWDETIEQCIAREVQEETGLKVLNLDVIGIASNPESQSIQYANGDEIQYFVIEFYTKEYQVAGSFYDEEEIVEIAFRSEGNLAFLPINERGIVESLNFFRTHKRLRLY